MSYSFSVTNNSICSIGLLATDPVSILTNMSWLIVLLIVLCCPFLIYKIKTLHNKNMAFLFHLIFITFLNAAHGLVNSVVCPPATYEICIVEVFINVLSFYLPQYALVSFSLHRLACVYFANLEKKLTWLMISFSLFATWLIPITVTLIQIYVLDVDFYNIEILNLCIFNSDRTWATLVMHTTFLIMVPNVVVLTAYTAVRVKGSKLKKKLNSSKRLEPPRVTLLLVTYIVTFEISHVFNLLTILQVCYSNLITSPLLLLSGRFIKFSQYFCPLGLFYFHPYFLAKYKKFWQWLCKFICVQSESYEIKPNINAKLTVIKKLEETIDEIHTS